MDEVSEGREFSFPRAEEEVLALWTRIDAFRGSMARAEEEKRPPFVFYDGPPFATGLPHFGHILAGTIKDIVTRYAQAAGFSVSRRFGWDCHGLPVEFEIDKKLGIKSRQDVEKFGIGNYNEECRAIVMRYSKEWERIVTRLGRWIDFENDYKTMDLSFMESVWWVFKQLYDKGLVYRGFKVMPYSVGCTTPLSNFESGLNYKDVSDPAVMVAFPLLEGSHKGAQMVAWTTTPWTLPSNLALCVHPEFVYVKVKVVESEKVYIVAEERLSEMPFAKKDKKKSGKNAAAEPKYQVLETMVGSDIVGTPYEPLFSYFSELKGQAFKVIPGTYVTADSGTGVVHCAPAFGEDDYSVCIAAGIIGKGEGIPNPVDGDGCFTSPVEDFRGVFVKNADKEIISKIKESGRLVSNGVLVHSYPFCWRSDTPLIYKAVPSYFVAVEQIKEKIIANNKKTYWVPSYVQEKRFHNWLENARDWAVSRNRYWGTPLPIWTSPDGEEVVVIGSIAELEKLSGRKITDIHRHFIDDIEIPSQRGPGFPPLKRIEEVFDCWFESGSMPYAQVHYPFENKENFESSFPANFIAEGLDQTRGWFYTLMVLSTALFDKPPFQNLICNGLVLAADGKKMSKRLKNYPDPMEVVDQHGSDALRLYLIDSPVVRAESMRFREEGVFAVVKEVFLPWYNAYRFLVQNANRYSSNTGQAFTPSLDAAKSSDNVLDKWMLSVVSSLSTFVKVEMEAYRLFTVVPRLIKFIDMLTNVYVRFNRRRMRGNAGDENDTFLALSALYFTLTTLCKIMAPFTPFFTETLFQNLKKAAAEDSDDAKEESVHYCLFPSALVETDARIEMSVNRMQTIIEFVRNIRDKRRLPIKSKPLRRMIIVHSDADFLEDVRGRLKTYICEELNVKDIETSDQPLQYASLKAEPEFSIVGKKVGKAMAAVAKAVKALSEKEILDFQSSGQLTVEGHTLVEGDIKVIRELKKEELRFESESESDGEVIVILDLTDDPSLAAEGIARELVNRVQQMRKRARLPVGFPVEVFYNIVGTPEANLSETFAAALDEKAAYLQEILHTVPAPATLRPENAGSLLVEDVTIMDANFQLELTKKCVFPSDTLPTAAKLYLSSRDIGKLKEECTAALGKLSVRVDGEDVVIEEGKDFFWSRPRMQNGGSVQG